MKLLVVGDSFMVPDIKFPGTHWTEIIGGCEVMHKAQIGASNSIIFHKLLEGLEHRPDAVVVGMTDSHRITFDRPPKHEGDPEFMTSAQEGSLTADQELLKTQYIALSSDKMNIYTSFFLLFGMLRELEHRKIPFVYTLGNLGKKKILKMLDDLPIQTVFDSFDDRMLEVNLSDYPAIKKQPGFPSYHVDSAEWQTNFANEVYQKLIDIRR